MGTINLALDFFDHSFNGNGHETHIHRYPTRPAGGGVFARRSDSSGQGSKPRANGTGQKRLIGPWARDYEDACDTGREPGIGRQLKAIMSTKSFEAEACDYAEN
jgi:hypothetical protein